MGVFVGAEKNSLTLPHAFTRPLDISQLLRPRARYTSQHFLAHRVVTDVLQAARRGFTPRCIVVPILDLVLEYAELALLLNPLGLLSPLVLQPLLVLPLGFEHIGIELIRWSDEFLADA